jgi:arylformamidase
MVADIAYGPGTEERLDLFLPEPGKATGAVHMFIHGGYWRMFSKQDFSFVAETVTRAGAIALIIDYALMPAVRMETIVAQVRHARDWVAGHIWEYGGDPSRLTISGHSAGAHLAALLVAENGSSARICGALLLSGIYDLAPLQRSFLQELIGLTDCEIAHFSPLRLSYPTGTAITMAVGQQETTPFHAQADAFAVQLARNGIPVDRRDIAQSNHMNIVADLGTPGTKMADLLVPLLLQNDS